MKLLVVDPIYDTGLSEEQEEIERAKFISSLKERFGQICQDVEIEDADIGRGTSEPAFLIALGAVAGLIALGKKINEGIEGWISVAEKLSLALKHLRRKYRGYRVDEDAASLLALNRISEIEATEISSFEKVSEEIIPISPFTEEKVTNFEARPDSIYIQIYRINEDLYYLFVIKSKGEVITHLRFSNSEWMFF